MNLSLFHPAGKFVKPNAPLNILNGATRRIPCQFLEWTGWYSISVKQRLLGHYRLFQLYKKHNGGEFTDLHLIENYILHYRSLHGIKYLITRILVFICSLLTPAETISITSIEEMNRTMLSNKPHILKQFLENADKDFAAALHQALSQINEISFLSDESNQSATIIVQAAAPPTPAPPAEPTLKGKQKGVFSKHQVLMLFDLMAQTGLPEKLNHTNPNKFAYTADFLHSLTGNPTDSWIQELQDHKSGDLYEFHKAGQVNQLIRDLSNISQQTKKAGWHTMANTAERKIVELERQKATLSDEPS